MDGVEWVGDLLKEFAEEFKDSGDGKFVIEHDLQIMEVTVKKSATIPDVDTRSLDKLLDFNCPDCGDTFMGKEQCRNTGKCPECSGNYAPVTLQDV